MSVLPFSQFGHKISANFSACSLKAAIFTHYFQGSTVKHFSPFSRFLLGYKRSSNEDFLKMSTILEKDITNASFRMHQ